MIWQLTPLNTAIQLKKLGADQKSLFYWNQAKDGPHKEMPGFGWTSNAIASAYTVAELGVMYGNHTSLIDPPVYAERLASMLIRDIIRGRISVMEVNKRLNEIIDQSDNK